MPTSVLMKRLVLKYIILKYYGNSTYYISQSIGTTNNISFITPHPTISSRAACFEDRPSYSGTNLHARNDPIMTSYWNFLGSDGDLYNIDPPTELYKTRLGSEGDICWPIIIV